MKANDLYLRIITNLLFQKNYLKALAEDFIKAVKKVLKRQAGAMMNLTEK